MKSCRECKDYNCLDQGNTSHNACEDFMPEEVGASAPASSPMSEEGREYMEKRLEETYDRLLVRMAILEGRWDRMISAMVRAANEEDV